MRQVWTKKEEKILLKHYPDTRTIDMVSKFNNRTVASICGHAHAMGIKKSEAFMKSALSGRTNGQHSTAGQFKKHCAGWNKGMKREQYMKPEALAKMKACEFKKGRDPHNTVPVGTESVRKDGYIEVKVKHGNTDSHKNFRFKHQVVYEAHHGPIPEGMVVKMVDGNKLNFNIDNLVLFTKAENMILNSHCDTSIVKKNLGIKDEKMIKQVIAEMPQLIELKRNNLILNSKLKKHANNSN